MDLKALRKAIVKYLKEKSNGGESKLKVIRKYLEEEDDQFVSMTKEDFELCIEKLIKKKKVVKKSDKVISLIESINEEKQTDSDENNDFQKDEELVVAAVHSHMQTSDSSSSTSLPKTYETVIEPCNATILLFYTYCTPPMTRGEQDDAIAYCYSLLANNGVTGRLRIGREGFNGTLTGLYDNIRVFTSSVRAKYPHIFGNTDFKYVDGQPDRHLLRGLKVWPVTEIVTYGFDPKLAPLEKTGNHLSPQEFHEAMKHPDAIMVDVRNFNETLIGSFAPPNEDGLLTMDKVLNPNMRRSTEFPEWIAANKHKLEGKKVLMYCTGGVRCERASAYVRNLGLEDVNQLAGGIHRYLDAYPKDGGFWIGKNYTFDKRFSHGAEEVSVISSCVNCAEPWDRYQAQSKCTMCSMEVLLCKTCQRLKPAVPKTSLYCPLCLPLKNSNLSGVSLKRKLGKLPYDDDVAYRPKEEEYFG